MKPQPLDRIWNVFTRGWKIKTVALILAALGVITDHVFHHELGTKLTVALVFIIGLSVYDAIYGLHQHLTETAKEVVDAHAQAAERVLRKADLIEDKVRIQTHDLLILHAIKSNDGAIRHVLESTYDSLKNTLEVLPDKASFAIHDHFLALKMYVAFWRNLVELQRERNAVGGPPLTALVVHRHDIGIWDNPILGPVFGLQKRFVDEGGSIHRILCGKDSQPDEHYTAIARRMIESRVKVYYCNWKDAQFLVSNPGLFDFLLIKETKQAVIWKDVNVDGQIDTATFTGNPVFGNNKSLEEIWLRILHESVPFSHFPQPYLES